MEQDRKTNRRRRSRAGRTMAALLAVTGWFALAWPGFAQPGDQPEKSEPPGPAAGASVGPAAGTTAEDELVVPVEGVYVVKPGPRLDPLSGPITRTREDFNKGNQTLIEVLEGVPGVAVREMGGAEGPWMVTVRGGGVKGAAVYLDGVLLNDPRGFVPDLSRVPMGLVDEVVVYRSAAPVGYPVAGTSGVIDIRTMPTATSRRSRVRLAYDSLETVEVSAAAAGEILGNALMIGARSEWGPGLFDYTDTRGTPKVSSDDRGRTRANNNFADHDVIVKGERKVAGYRLYAAGYYQYSEREQPGQDHQRPDSARVRSDRILAYAGAKRPAALGSDLDAEVRIHGLWERSWIEDPDGELGPARDDKSQRVRLGTDAFFNYYGLRQNKLSLYLGVYNGEYIPASEIDRDLDAVSAQRASVYFNASDEVSLFNNRLKLLPRLGYAFENNHYQGPTLADQLGLGIGDSSYSTSNLDLSLALLLTTNLWLTGAAGQYHRAPDFLEEQGDRLDHVGNPSLDPERSDVWEVGLRYDMGPVLEIDSLQAEVSVYQVSLSDRIGWTDLGAGLLGSENMGDALITGVEAGLHFNLRDRLLVEASYTWQDAEDLGDDPRYRHNQLPELARNSAAIAATLYQPYGRIYYKGYYQDQRWLDEANTISAGPRFIHSLGIGYYRGKWTVGIEGVNLGNDQSREVLGYPLPGTRYMVMLEYQE